MASRNSAIVSKFVKRSLSASTQPEQVKKSLKHFTEIPGLTVKDVLVGMFKADLRKGLENTAALWAFGDMVKVEIPLKPPILFLFDPELCETVYRAAGAQPIRPGFDALRHVRSQDPIIKGQGAQGLLTSSGEDWYKFRSKVQQPMLRPKSTLCYTPQLEKIAQEFIERKIIAKKNPENDQMGVDFLDDLYKWSLESVACLALNTRLGCLEEELIEGSHQMQIIRAVSDIFSSSMYLDSGAQLWRFLPSLKLNRFTNGYDTFRDLCSVYIARALEDIKNKDPNSEEDPSLLEQFFARGCDETTAIVMALDMMFAGIDTSSHTSSYAMFQLAKHPEVQEKLYREIKKELPDKDSKLEIKSLDRMPYLRAVLKETLRTNPAAPAMARILPQPLELNGYQIPENTVYVFTHYHMGNSPRYIDQPEKFMPERWLRSDPNNQLDKIHPFLILPFGHGSRMCIGKRFAEQEVSIFLAKIIQKFQVEWHHPDMGMITETITKPSVPLRFTFRNRSE